jgi:hypothetical protein
MLSQIFYYRKRGMGYAKVIHKKREKERERKRKKELEKMDKCLNY